MRVTRWDPLVGDASQSDAIRAAIDRVLGSGRFVGGVEIELLERELAITLDVPSVVTCGSGTDALALALEGVRHLPERHPLPHGERIEVVTTPLTFVATASAIRRAGMVPRFVDVDSDTLLIDWKAAHAARARARAVVPVHLYGRTCAPPPGWDGPPVVEDACQAFGAARAGRVGDAAAFSFFPSKPLGCYGDGGAVVASMAVADHVRTLAHHGINTVAPRSTHGYYSAFVGYNSRLDALQAAVLRAKLPTVESHRVRREQIAHAYADQLSDQGWLRLPDFVEGHAWHCYTTRVLDGSRDARLHHLREQGIDAVVQYPVPLHRMRAFSNSDAPSLPNAEAACDQILGLPIWFGMTDDQVDSVVLAMRSF